MKIRISITCKYGQFTSGKVEADLAALEATKKYLSEHINDAAYFTVEQEDKTIVIIPHEVLKDSIAAIVVINE